jgi:hypothetical protein
VTRLLLAVALAAGTLLTAAPAAHACDAQSCPWSQPVCDRFDCDHLLCFVVGEGSFCITP